ncbi:MAG: carbohydrate ABC transporter permease [bacterium]
MKVPSRRSIIEAVEGYLFVSPWIAGFLIFIGGPIVMSFFYSLTDWHILRPPQFVGLKNYIQILPRDRLFWQALKVTFYYTLGVPLRLGGALVVALIMNQKLRGMGVFRTIYYMPSVVAGVAVALLWLWIFNPEMGILNLILAKFGIKGPEWLWSEKWVVPAFIIMSLWGVGGSMIIYLGGLQSIPTALYEAAEIDGAGIFQKFWSITLPMLSPVIFFNLIMQIIDSFQVFTNAFIMTNGGPANASLFYVLYLYRNAFEWFKMGYASALAWVLLLIIMFFTMLVFKSSALWVYYEGEVRARRV